MLAFDTGIRKWHRIRAAAKLGGLTASCSGTPTAITAARRLLTCGMVPHNERADAETDGGAHNFDLGNYTRSALPITLDPYLGCLAGENHRHLTDGDDVAGSRSAFRAHPDHRLVAGIRSPRADQ